MSVLRVENLSKRYGKKQVLKGITCEFHTGINALLGPNGAGKTTIMNCISGVIKKSGGSVTLDGQDVSEMGEKYREKLSFQFQYQPFYPSYTAHEFLRFSALLKGMPEPLIEDEIWRVLRLVNLSENLDDKIKSFSGGMKTDAGIDRIVPIHSKILDLVKKKYDEAVELHSEYLLNATGKFTKSNDLTLTYDKFKSRYYTVRDNLHLNPAHKPHDGRKHFITMAKKYKVDEYAIKYMVGHEISDLTEKIYTKREISWLKEEIEKIK